MRETLEEIGQLLHMENEPDPLAFAFDIDGNPVASLMELDPECRVLVVSTSPEFQGLEGMDKFFRRANEGRKRPTVKLHEVKPKPGTWVHTAAVSWLNHNETVNMPNTYMEGNNSYVAATAPDTTKREGQLMDALRQHHTQVHIQDQRLLNAIADPVGSSSPTRRKDISDTESVTMLPATRP